MNFEKIKQVLSISVSSEEGQNVELYIAYLTELYSKAKQNKLVNQWWMDQKSDQYFVNCFLYLATLVLLVMVWNKMTRPKPYGIDDLAMFAALAGETV